MTTTSYNIYQQITSVRLASTANLSGSYFNGALNNGVGATLTALANGPLSVDGVLVQVGDRLLLKDQTIPSQNGLYVVQTPGYSSGLWMIERSPDFQSLEQLKVGQYFSVGGGSTLAGSMFVLVEPLPTTIGMGVFTFVDVANTSPPAGPYLLKENNLSDVNSSTFAVENIGLGRPGILILTDADFAAGGGTYILTNPPPIYVSMTATAPGRILKLPPQNEATSLQASQNITLLTGNPSQAINIHNGAGVLVFQVAQDSAWQAIPNDRSTIAGAWEFLGVVQTINGNLTGNVVLSNSNQMIYVSTTGNDTLAADGSIFNPYASLSYALSQITTASQATPFEIVMSTGSYVEPGNVSLKPWVHVEGNNALLTIAGQLLLDASWGTVVNPRTFVRFMNINAVGGAVLNRTIFQANSLLFFNAVNFQGTPTLSASGSGTNVDAEVIAFFYCLPIQGGGPSMTFTNLLSACIGSGFQNDTTFINNSAVTNNVSLIENTVPLIGNTTFQSTNTGVMTVIMSSVARFSGSFTVDGTNVQVLIDSNSWNFTPLFLNGASITQIVLNTKSDGSDASSYNPVNYTPVGAATYPSNSVTAYLAGIDTAIAAANNISSAFGEMYFQGNVTLTTIAAANTPVKVDATYNSGELSNFTQATGTLTYTGSENRRMLVTADLTATYNGTAQNTSFYITLNGSVVAKSQQKTFIGDTTPANRPNPCKCIVSMGTGDQLELWVENNDNANDILISDLNYTVESLEGTPVNVINYLLRIGTLLVPHTSYATGVLTPVYDTLNGTNLIGAGTFDIGDSLEMTMTGVIRCVNAGSGVLTASFGAIFSVNSQVITFAASGATPCEFRFKITRISVNQITASIAGWYEDLAGVMHTLEMVISPFLWPYNAAITNDMSLQWTATVAPGDTMDFVAVNLNIIQFK